MIGQWAAELRTALAALAAPTGPQPAGGGVDDAVIKRAMMKSWSFVPDSVLGHPARMQWLGRRFLQELAAIKGDSHAG